MSEAPRTRSLLELGLTAERIHRELRDGLGFGGSYQSVKRFAAQIRESQPQRVQRLESAPGEEALIDFGQGPMVKDTHGKRRRTDILRVVLSFSRKGYSEALLRHGTEIFLRCLVKALRHFGGVPKVLNVDNLKVAVPRAEWFDSTSADTAATATAHARRSAKAKSSAASDMSWRARSKAKSWRVSLPRRAPPRPF